MRTNFIILFCILFFSLPVRSNSYYEVLPIPKYEVRAVWLTTIGGLDWPHNYAQSLYSIEKQKKELISILDQLQQSNINTVLLQTRIRGTLIFPSQYEPWDGCLSGVPGKSPGYDALEFAIKECHKRGIELHAWVVTIPVGKWNGTGCKKLRNKYSKLIRKIGDEGYMDPSKEETADYLANICAEITRNYDIDGIHLDYIRYPENWPEKSLDRDNGRFNITRIVRKIHNAVKSQKAWVKMSCSPIGKYNDLGRYWSRGWNAYNKGCQDAQGWLKLGLMDALFPMMYFKGDQFYPFMIDWAEQACGKIVSVGLGIYMMDKQEKNWPLETITREMNVLRSYGLGQAFFRNKFYTDNLKGIFDYSRDYFYRYPALIPPMTWEHSTPPSAPYNLKIQNDLLIWEMEKSDVSSSNILYNIYASSDYPVNIDDAKNLLLPSQTSMGLKIDKNKSLYYAVTSMDRFGNESSACQLPIQMVIMNKDKHLFNNDGDILYLPDDNSELDAQYLIIGDLSGRIITTCKNSCQQIGISNLSNGCYVVRTVNNKGISHRLGFFIIKRKTL